MSDGNHRSRYSTIRDYVLLALGVGLLASGAIGVLEGNQGALALIGGGLTCCGLVPTIARDKER